MRLVPLAVLLALVTPVLCLADKTADAPHALIEELYQSEKNGVSPFEEQKTRSALDHYFTKDLAGLIWKDGETSRKKNEVGVIDFAPLYGAQDLDIKKLMIGKSVTTGNKTTVLVSFVNFDQKTSVTYDLVQGESSWKISDIHYSAGPSLRAMFKAAGAKP